MEMELTLEDIFIKIISYSLPIKISNLLKFAESTAK